MRNYGSIVVIKLKLQLQFLPAFLNFPNLGRLGQKHWCAPLHIQSSALWWELIKCISIACALGPLSTKRRDCCCFQIWHLLPFSVHCRCRIKTSLWRKKSAKKRPAVGFWLIGKRRPSGRENPFPGCGKVAQLISLLKNKTGPRKFLRLLHRTGASFEFVCAATLFSDET